MERTLLTVLHIYWVTTKGFFFLHTNLFFAPNILPLFFGCSKSNSSSNGFSRLCDRVIQRSSSSSQQLKMGGGEEEEDGMGKLPPNNHTLPKVQCPVFEHSTTSIFPAPAKYYIFPSFYEGIRGTSLLK